MADPGVEGEAFVPSEGPCLSGGRCVVVYIRCDDQKKYQNSECVDAARRQSLLEDVDELRFFVSPEEIGSETKYLQGSRLDQQGRRRRMGGRRDMLLG